MSRNASSASLPVPVAHGWRQWRSRATWFIGVMALGLLLTGLVIAFAPRKYRSQARLLVKVGRENVALDPTVTTVGDTVNLHRTDENEIHTTLNVMKSRDIMRQVVDSVGPQPILDGYLPGENDDGGPSTLGNIKGWIKSWVPKLDPIDDREKALLTLKDNFDIGNSKNASVVEVEYQAKSPELAHEVVDRWITAYLRLHSELNTTEGSFEFFETQRGELVEKLAAARQRLREAKTNAGVATVAGAQQSLETELTAARNWLIESKRAEAASKARVESLADLMSSTDEQIITEQGTTSIDAMTQRMRDRLYALEIEERSLASRLRDGHPQLVSVREQLDEARRVYDRHRPDTEDIKQGINPLHVTLGEQIALETGNVLARRAEVASLETTIERLRNELRELNKNEIDIAAIDREVQMLETQYRDQFVRFEQARLAEELSSSDISNVRVVQHASRELRPVTPNKKLCAILGMFGSLLAAAGVVTLREAAKFSFGDAPSESLVDVPDNASSGVITPDDNSVGDGNRRDDDRGGNNHHGDELRPAEPRREPGRGAGDHRGIVIPGGPGLHAVDEMVSTGSRPK